MYENKLRALTVFTCVLLFGVTAAVAAADTAEVQAVEGLVQYRLPDSEAWADLNTNEQLPVGTTVISGRDGSAVLASGSTTIEVSPLSRLTISDVEIESDREATEVEMSYGNIRSRVRRSRDRGTNFSVRSPVSTASVRGTEFEYDGRELAVFSGDVAFANLTGQQHSVRAGQTSRTYRHLPIESVEATLLEDLSF